MSRDHGACLWSARVTPGHSSSGVLPLNWLILEPPSSPLTGSRAAGSLSVERPTQPALIAGEGTKANG